MTNCRYQVPQICGSLYYGCIPAILLLSAGCAGLEGTASSPDLAESWEDYRATHLFGEGPSGEAYLVDDMMLGEAELWAMFEEEQVAAQIDPDGSGVGLASPELIADAPFGSISWRDVPTIDYCFSAPGSWGQVNGNVIDGFYTAPALAPTIAAIDEAARRWNGVANVRFRHRTDLDGNGCDVDLRYSGEIQFWVGHWDGAYGGPGSTGTAAVAPFPSATNEYQVLLVPPAPGGISVALAIHELGHVLGFRHEHERDEASPRCDSIAAYAPLTENDPGSVMMYANCTVSQAIIGLQNPSRLDGIGARIVYGEPHWWWSGVPF